MRMIIPPENALKCSAQIPNRRRVMNRARCSMRRAVCAGSYPMIGRCFSTSPVSLVSSRPAAKRLVGGRASQAMSPFVQVSIIKPLQGGVCQKDGDGKKC